MSTETFFLQNEAPEKTVLPSPPAGEGGSGAGARKGALVLSH